MEINDRLVAAEGSFYFSGMSMLVRLVVEQALRDRDAGLRTGTLVTGYPGSPLAGFDLQLAKSGPLLASRDVRLVPAGNEEQAVTALTGTQMLDEHPHTRYDGVTGFWYGKGPGLDRAGDALRHANFAGTSEHGAVVVLSGEDHEAKSSTMPFQQEYAFVSAGMPVLYPSSVAEFRTLGLHAVAMSRYSGCWVALKLTSALCDGGETAAVRPGDVCPCLPEGPFRKRADFSFYPGKNISHEHHLYRERHAAVLAYARRNGLNRVDSREPGDRIGIVTAGKSAADVRQTLADCGLDPFGLAGSGIAMLTLGMTYPLDEEQVRSFCDGLDEVVVVEEKRGFLEDAVRAAIQPLPGRVRVVGKLDRDGAPLFPVEGGMDADLVARLLAPLLAAVRPSAACAARLAELDEIAARSYPGLEARTPNFCSGCPHSASTVLAEGQIAFGAPGCACFNTVIEQPERHIDTMTQYGGEGLPWIGLAPYTDRPHLVQHVGDGSIFHSSYLNIRWAVATGTRMTFKLLWNGVVANTGAQPLTGARGLAALTRGLESEGVKRIVICSKDPGQYRRQRLGRQRLGRQRLGRQRLGRGVEVRRAEAMVSTAQELAAVDGVTVLIYDESCANERRRRIKRGLLPPPAEYALINEDVCENCGDCGAKSNCMSLQKTATEFGPKTQIHSSSCNQDFSCLQGDCPSFATVRVRPGTGYRRPAVAERDVAELDVALPDPLGAGLAAGSPFHIYLPGVGGTGVISLNAMLAFAATFDGYDVVSYDQTGAAQKWGPVLSSLILVPEKAGPAYANKVGQGRADLLLVLDEVAAATPANLDRCSPRRTAAVVNTDLFPTGQMVRDVSHVVDGGAYQEAIGQWVRSMHGVPARVIAEKLLGDYMMTNMVVVGAAYQAGLLPLRAESVERAIELNGVAVRANTLAFRYGRLWAHDPDAVRRLLDPAPLSADAERVRRAGSLSARNRRFYAQLLADAGIADVSAEVARLIAVRAAELLDYQGPAWARRYVDRVLAAHRVVSARLGDSRVGGGEGLVESVARNLYQLMAYKDEYEVARLFLKPAWREQVAATFEAPVKVLFNLHPPAARRLGRERKVRLGPWFVPALWVLRAGRRLRGTRLDPFGIQRARREERELIGWYTGLVDEALASLRPANAGVVGQIVRLPEGIRGYEGVKSRNAAAARERADELLGQLSRPLLPVLAQGPHDPAAVPR